MDIKDLQHLAELARMEISEEEQKTLLTEIDPVLQYVEQIREVAVGSVVPEAGEVRNVMREDGEPHETGLYTDELLAAAPDSEKGYVKVKNIL